MADGIADAGSVATGNSTEAGSISSEGNGSGAGVQADNWLSVFQGEGNRTVVEAKGWKSPDDVVRSYRGLEGKLGEMASKNLLLPGDDAKPEDWASFYAKTGRPEKPEGYEFKLPEGLPENFPYRQDDAVKFKNWAHANGLQPKQAQALHDEFVRDRAGELTKLQENESKAFDTAHNELVKMWGDPASETFKRNQELANRTLRQQGGDQLIGELKSIGALGANGQVKSPRLANLLAKVGTSLYAEDTLFAGPGSVANPFSDKSENMTEQGRIIRSDPSRARQLVLSAGKDPKEWGL